MAERQKGVNMTSEKLEEHNIRQLAECITSWAWPDDLHLDGAPIPELTVDNAIMVLSKLQWYFDQVNREMAADENFLEDAPDNS